MNQRHEDKMHRAFWEWCSLNPFIRKYMCAIEHGELRDKKTGAKLKRKGVRKGMLDFYFMHPNKHYNSLWIEFKYGKNKLTESQIEFTKRIEESGQQWVCCWSIDDGIQAVTDYLKEDFE